MQHEKHSQNLPDIPSIRDIVKRLEVLEAEKAILYTLYRYGHCIDYNLDREWVELFTADALFANTRTGQEIRGHKALAEWITGFVGAPAEYHKHLLTEPVIFLESNDKARAESYHVHLAEKEGVAFVFGFGRYRDLLVKQNGRWLFKERIYEAEASLSGGVPWRPGNTNI